MTKPLQKIRRIISGALLIGGTATGAGMLGIPLVTNFTGFWPGVCATIAVWFFMLITGLLFLEVALWMPKGSNLLSMAARFLGKRGKWVAGIMFIFLYYCLMVAYFAAGAPILSEVIGKFTPIEIEGIWRYLIFGAFFTVVVGLGARSIDRTNIFLIVAMILSYFFLVGIGKGEVKTENLAFQNWSFFLFPVPILFSAFGFHNVIPPLATYLEKDRVALKWSIMLGTLIPLGAYLVWQWLVLGVVDHQSIGETLSGGGTAAQALQLATGNRWIASLAQYFAFFAIITSLLGVSFSMVDFLQDAWKRSSLGSKRFLLTIVTFFPPFVFASIDPTIFDRALGLAGGFGESVLNGLFPVLLVWAGRYRFSLPSQRGLPSGKGVLIAVGAISVFVIFLEIWHLLTI